VQLDEVNKLIRVYQDIFDSNVTNVKPDTNTNTDPVDGTKYLFAYWPKRTGKNSTEGFKLKSGMGTISIEVVYKYKNSRALEEIGHSFRYFNSSHTYVFEYQSATGKDCDIGAYSFRYDKDLRPSSNDLPEHLQVLHTVPRFITNKVGLRDFFLVVKDSCFNGSGVAIDIPFFANRR